MKRSELKEIIKSAMLAEVTSMEEAKKVDVEDNEDINIDVEDEVDVDDVSKKSEIEVDSELAGEDADISAILGLLTKAQDEAKSLGDEKLMDQIGNTITYYTRAHVVATNEEQGMDPERFQGSGGDEVDSDSIINVTKDNPAEDAEIGFALDESIKRFQKLAGIKPSYGNLNELGDEKLSSESSEWLKDQINMYFDGGDELEPGGRGEFEITRMEQGDPKKYQDAQSAQKFLDELKVIKSVVVRFDDYIGDILVLSDREGDAMVSWTNPGDNQVVPEDYSKGNELEVEQSRTDQLLKQADILTDDERDYAFDVLSKMHQKLNPTLDVEKTQIIIDFAESVLQEFYE